MPQAEFALPLSKVCVRAWFQWVFLRISTIFVSTSKGCTFHQKFGFIISNIWFETSFHNSFGKWMDGSVRVLRPFNSISVISRRWKGEHERLCAMKRRLGSGRISPPAGFEPASPWTEVGSANCSATQTLLLENGHSAKMWSILNKQVSNELASQMVFFSQWSDIQKGYSKTRDY